MDTPALDTQYSPRLVLETSAEQEEQKKLYKIYLGEIRQQFSQTLDNVSVEEKDGKVVPFKEAFKNE